MHKNKFPKAIQTDCLFRIKCYSFHGVRVSLLFCNIQRKGTGENPRYLFRCRRRDSTGLRPVEFASRTVYFMSLFAPQKDGRRVRVSPNKFIYTKRKSTKKKSLCFFWRRRRDSNSRAGYPTYALSRGASSPT